MKNVYERRMYDPTRWTAVGLAATSDARPFGLQGNACSCGQHHGDQFWRRTEQPSVTAPTSTVYLRNHQTLSGGSRTRVRTTLLLIHNGVVVLVLSLKTRQSHRSAANSSRGMPFFVNARMKATKDVCNSICAAGGTIQVERLADRGG